MVYEIAEMTNGLTSRIWLKNKKSLDKESKRNETINVQSSGKSHCTTETAYIKQGVSDILQPIQFRVTYTMEKEDIIGSPVLNTTATKTFLANFQKECDNNTCRTLLEVDAETDFACKFKFSFKKKQYFLTDYYFTDDTVNHEYIIENITDGEFVLNTSVINKGDPAYNAKLFIVHPKALSYIGIKEKGVRKEKHFFFLKN